MEAMFFFRISELKFYGVFFYKVNLRLLSYDTTYGIFFL